MVLDACLPTSSITSRAAGFSRDCGRRSIDARDQPSAWEAAQTDMGEVPAAVVACIQQRGAEINSAGGYLPRSDAKIRVRRFFAWPDPDGAD
jgi:replication initiation protein RepC